MSAIADFISSETCTKYVGQDIGLVGYLLEADLDESEFFWRWLLPDSDYYKPEVNPNRINVNCDQNGIIQGFWIG